MFHTSNCKGTASLRNLDFSSQLVKEAYFYFNIIKILNFTAPFIHHNFKGPYLSSLICFKLAIRAKSAALSAFNFSKGHLSSWHSKLLENESLKKVQLRWVQLRVGATEVGATQGGCN